MVIDRNSLSDFILNVFKSTSDVRASSCPNNSIVKEKRGRTDLLEFPLF